MVNNNERVYRMITQYPRAITEWLVVPGVEERGVSGVEANSNRPHFEIGGGPIERPATSSWPYDSKVDRGNDKYSSRVDRTGGSRL